MTTQTPNSREVGGDVLDEELLPELVAHLRENRTQLRQEWAARITEAHLLQSMTAHEIFSEATAVYENYVEVLETGSVEALQRYARDLSERIIPRGFETHEVVGIGRSTGPPGAVERPSRQVPRRRTRPEPPTCTRP